MTEIFVYKKNYNAQEHSTFYYRNFIWLSTVIDIIIVLFRVVNKIIGILQINVALSYGYLKSC